MRIPKYRLFPLLAATALVACSPAAREFAFPAAVGEWKLEGGGATVAEIPGPLGRLGVKSARSARYQGAGRMTVTVYTMASSAAALEAEQTWKSAAATVAFHRGAHFLTVSWENVDQKAVSGFVREMEKLAER